MAEHLEYGSETLREEAEFSLHGGRERPNGMGTDHPLISLAYLPPTPRQARSALVAAAILLLGLAVLAPFAAKPLPRVNGFIPALDAIIFITDLITASLLFAHFSIARSRAILALVCGYLFTALIIVAHGLTFPVELSPTELRMNFRLFLLWHLGLPVALLFYVWLRGKDLAKGSIRKPTAFVAVCSVSGVLALVGCLVWLAGAGDELLPLSLSGLDRSGPVAPLPNVLAMSICAAALLVLWVFRRSVLDQWLMVVVLASMEEPVLSLFGSTRFALGFYAGRAFWLVTSAVVLILLLTETTRLYAGVARASMLASILNASRTLSSEIELPKLIEQLMRIAIDYATADRGLLILPSGGEYLVRAEAQAIADQTEIVICRQPVTQSLCPESLVHHVIRTRKSVILDDASQQGQFSDDDYLRDRRSKSILCFPLIKQNELIGIIFLENGQTSHSFRPAQIGLLELFAGQAAIALENARLYSDLELQVGLLQQLPVSAWTLKPDGTPDFVNQVWLDFSGQTLDFVRSHPEAWMTAVHPEDREAAARTLREAVRSGRGFAFETKSLRARDGVYRRHLQQAVVLRDADGKVLKFVGTTTDIDDQKRAEETLLQTQADLAHVARVATLNAMTASIAHEVSQPLSGILTNANTSLRMLGAEPPNLAGVAETVRRTVRDANRAFGVIQRLREMFSNKEPITEAVDLNNAVRDVIAISSGELQRRSARLQIELADRLPAVGADRVQLQQVILNLLLNAVDAMDGIEDRPRSLLLRTQLENDGAIRLDVQDAGTGFDPATAEKLFEPFYTTKVNGMGIGLSICRSIIEGHKGNLWATPNNGPGATFSFSIPAAAEPAARTDPNMSAS